MTAFFSWYILVTLLGWLTFPLAYRLFPALMDRGYTLARTAGLLVWGFVFWWMATLGFVQNDVSGLLLALFVLAGLSVWAFLSTDRSTDRGPRTVDRDTPSTVHRPLSVFDWLRENWQVVLTTEILFLAAFAFLAFIRSANPEILGTEKPMELAFINGILRSPTFPPRDPWLSGYAISYYYFGYVLTAMLARITAMPGTLAFNLMLALVFALGAIGAYGILYNLLAAQNASHIPQRSGADATRNTNHEARITDPRSPITALLAPLFLLFVSNVEGFLELLHRYGLFWQFKADGSAVSPFWSWLDIKDLNQPPTLPLGGVPGHWYWWWRASRVIQDYYLNGDSKEIIDEFPAFSFVLGDLHPHVLAIPFGLLAVAVALNIYLGGWRGSIPLLGARLHISPLGFAVAALVLGGLTFLNVWDILAAATLMTLAYILFRVREDGWSWARAEDLLLFGLPLVASAILLYLPFYLSFSSQAGGLLPNLVSPTRGAHLWVMFGTLFLPIFAYLIYLTVTSQNRRWRTALTLTLGLPLVLWALSWLLGLAVILLRPDVATLFLAVQGVTDTTTFFAAAFTRRLLAIGGLLTLMAILFPALAFFFDKSQVDDSAPEPSDFRSSTFQPSNLQPTPFVILLILLGTVLVIGPEFFYLRDQFGWRMNTIFKFYYQAWMLWSLAASFGIAVLLKNLRGVADWAFRIFIVLLIFVGLVYPVMAFATKTNNLNLPNGFTLDDFDRVKRENPDEAAAIQFLTGAGDGVVAEASIVGASYTGYSRISTYTGLPTVLGWSMHESQWRGTYEPQGTRQDDLATLYTTPDWETARQIIQKYNIRYIFIGGLERTTYRVQEDKFYQALPIVFQQGGVTIYEASQTGMENR